MRRWSILPIVAISSLVGSCSLLMPHTIGGPPPPTTPIALPISAVVPGVDTRVEGDMQVRGPCLTILVRDEDGQGPNILPIWPAGFAAKGAESEGVVLTGPLGTAHDAVNSERLELHGTYVDEPPADAVVPPECADYPFFLVGRALNIAE